MAEREQVPPSSKREEVGGSGVYPASSPNAPPNAQVRTEAELVGHRGPEPRRRNEQDVKKSDQSSGSE